MKKPEQLRAHLSQALPVFQTDPQRLKLFVDEGHIVATGAVGLSFEYRYTLTLIVTDYHGSPDRLIVPLLAWLREHQRELFDNPALQESIRFEAEILDHGRVDLELHIPLTERIGVQEMVPNQYQIAPFPEPPTPVL